MLRNTTRYKKVILSLVIATTLTSFNSSLVEAATLGGIYKSKSVVKNYIDLENEIAEALKIGADTAEINIDNTFENEFYRNYNAKFNSIINNAKFKADDYHHFLISQNSGSIKGNIAKYDFVYHETTSETKQVEDKVKEIVGNIIKSGMTEDEKFKTIHDYIVTHVQYDSNGLNVRNESHSAYAALFRDKGGDEKQTVCQGYSLLFYRMATEAGLEARIMTGTAGGPHAWNLIKVNGKWYQVDLTWDDPVGMSDPNYKRYDYYALTDEQLKKDHTIFDNSDKYPICNTEYKNASTNEIILHEIGKLNISAPVIATTREEFKAILIDNIKRGKNKASITYGNTSDIPYILGEVEREFSSVINNLDCKYTQSGSLYTYNIGINYKNPINSIVTSSNSYNLKLGTPQGIKVTANMKSGATKDVTADAYYLSSNSQVAVVDRNTGKIIPKLAGKANILVMINGLEQTVSVNVLPQAVKSNNAKLSSLNVNGALVDGFSSDKLSYAVKLAAGTNTVPTVTAAEADSKANKVIVQAKNLTGSEAERTSTVKVTAEDGTIKEYKVVFSVEQPAVVKSNNAKLSSLNVNGALVDGFSSDKLSYAVKLAAGTNTVPTVTAAEADSKANKAIVQAKNLTGSEAERTSAVKVTAEDGTIKEYKIVFSVKPEEKPTDNSNGGVKPGEKPTDNSNGGVKPGEKPTDNSNGGVKPGEKPTDNSNGGVKPGAKPTNNSNGGVKPVAKPTNNSNSGVKPVAKPTNNSNGGVKPVAKPTNNSNGGVKPVAKPTNNFNSGVKPRLKPTNNSNSGVKSDQKKNISMASSVDKTNAKTNAKTSKLPLDTTEKKVSGEKADRIKIADNNLVDNRKKNENESSQSTNLDKDTKNKIEISNKEKSPYNKKVAGSMLGVLGVGALAGIVILKKLKK